MRRDSIRRIKSHEQHDHNFHHHHDHDHIRSRDDLGTPNSAIHKERSLVLLPKLAARQLVIQIKSGQMLMHQLTCNELLKLVRKNCDTSQCNAKGLLTYRDCKQLLSSTDVIPAIDTRFECILVRLFPISAIILKSLVLVVTNEDVNVDDFLQQLVKLTDMYHGDGAQSSRDALQDYETSLPFEVSMLQCCFSNVILQTHRELEKLEDRFKRIEEMVEDNNRKYKHVSMALHELKHPTSRILQVVTGYNEIMENLLEDPQEIKLLEFANHPSVYGMQQIESPPSALGSGHAQEAINVDLEILLEYVDQEVEQLFSRAKALDASIVHLESHMNMGLAITRNELMRFELMASMVSAALGFGGCLTGIFGMNIVSGVEESAIAFVLVCVVVMLTVFFTLILMRLLFRKNRV